MRPLLVLLILSALSPALSPLSAASFEPGPQIDGSESEQTWMVDREQEAARHRIARAAAPADPARETSARAEVARARAALAAGRIRDGRRIAEKAFKRHRTTAAAAQLQHVVVDAHAASGRISDLTLALVRLWLEFPDYPAIATAMQHALEAAEKAQDFVSKVDLGQEDPALVVDISGTSYQSENDRLFRFLALHGDQQTVGPRAALGLARATLLSSDRKDMREVRMSYESFLDRHPDHELTFTALCEMALSHLVTYRGDHFDVGALVLAASIIDQAELETRGDAARSSLVQAYRTRIRGWHQDRDLQVARWYRDRKRPAWLAWLREPSPARWEDSARFYYDEVVRRDASSEAAQAARREVAELPQAKRDALGTDLIAPTPR